MDDIDSRSCSARFVSATHTRSGKSESVITCAPENSKYLTITQRNESQTLACPISGTMEGLDMPRMTTHTESDVMGMPVEMSVSDTGLVSFNGSEWYAIPELDEWEESYFGFGGHWFTHIAVRNIGNAIVRWMTECDTYL